MGGSAMLRGRDHFGGCFRKLQDSSADGDQELRKGLATILLVALFLAEARQVRASASWGERTLQHYTLELNSPCFGADISPDDRFVAVYSENLPRRSEDEATYEIQIWDWRAGKIVARKIVLQERPFDARRLHSYEHFVRYADAGAKLIIYQEGRLLVLNSRNLEQIRDIDLGMSPWPSNASDVEVDSTGRRAAVLIPWGPNAGGELRAYDLESGELLRTWKFPNGVEKVGSAQKGLNFFPNRPIAIAPDGKKIAVSLMLPVPDEESVRSEDRNVLVLDVDSGQTTAAIDAGYLAGPVRFAPGDPLRLVTVPGDDDSANSKRNSIKIWNATTGALIREITSRPAGVRNYMDVSADGQVVAGFIGYQKCGFWLLGMESGCGSINKRFRLWNLSSGKVMAASSENSAVLESIGLSPVGDIRSRYDHLCLSPKGDLVLIYNGFDKQLRFFELR
jgi:WD40 repeat protein